MGAIEHPDDYLKTVEEHVSVFREKNCVLIDIDSRRRTDWVFFSIINSIQMVEDDTDSVLLGLRVYTKKYAPVSIAGQLRHGHLVHWKNT